MATTPMRCNFTVEGADEGILKKSLTIRSLTPHREREVKEVKMETPRTLALRSAAVMVTVLPIITSVYYSGGDAVDRFVEFLLYLSG